MATTETTAAEGRVKATADGIKADKQLATLFQQHRQAWDNYFKARREAEAALQESEEHQRLEARADALEREPCRFADEIERVSADSYAGLLVKFQLLHEKLGGIFDDKPHSEGARTLIRSIARDVERLAGVS